MNAPRRTLIWLAAITIGFILVVTVTDVYLIATSDEPNRSYSAALHELARENPIVPIAMVLVIGIVIGHIFWPVKHERK